ARRSSGFSAPARERPLPARPALPRGKEFTNMQRLGVVGAGTMGIGIVQVAAQQGLDVVVCEVDEARVHAAVDGLRRTLDRLVERGRLVRSEADRALARIRPTATYADLADVDCVIEAVFEDLDVKRDVFGQLDTVCREDAI